MSSPSLLERARARNPLPTGTIAAGAGFGIAGITIYVFLAVAARALGADRYASLSAMWAITFLAAPGVYFPIEQEVGRALADRRARGFGGAPVVRRAAVLAVGFAVGLVGLSVAASPLLLEHFFEHQVLLLAGFSIALASYALQHLSRGTLAGSGRFSSYGLVIGYEGVVRMCGCLALALAGVATAGPYAMVVGAAPLLAVLFVAPRERGLLADGPPAAWRELGRAFGYLLVGSVLAQAMINVTPLVVSVLASDSERSLVGKVLIALIVARIPVFMFQAVQASLIPQFAGLAASGQHHEFRRRLVGLLGAVTVVASVFAIGATFLGPTVVRLFFGSEFELGGRDMGLLAAASGAFMLAMALGQTLISMASYRRAALGWVVGIVILFSVTTLPGDTLLRAERGFLVGAAAATATMGILLRGAIRNAKPPTDEPLATAPLTG